LRAASRAGSASTHAAGSRPKVGGIVLAHAREIALPAWRCKPKPVHLAP
jgi:hypothetical protein